MVLLVDALRVERRGLERSYHHLLLAAGEPHRCGQALETLFLAETERGTSQVMSIIWQPSLG